MGHDPITGIIPVAPAVFDADENLDLDGVRRAIRYLVDAGSDAISLLANYSEQFSLTDDERETLLRASFEAAGDTPLCVTTSHWSSKIAAERSRHAQELGAAFVMLMPPFVGASMTVPEQGIIDFFATVADAIDIPIMVQDAPMSPTLLTPELMARIAREVDLVSYVKVETARAAGKIRRLAEIAPELPGLFDGEEATTLIPDLEAGAIGCMSSGMLPRELGRIITDFAAGRHDEAERAWESLLPLIHFENRQLAQAATKVLMAEGGIIGSDTMRSPFPATAPNDRAKLVEMARKRDAFILNWA